MLPSSSSSSSSSSLIFLARLMIKGCKKEQIRQCLGFFVQLKFRSWLVYKSAVQKPKHFLTCSVVHFCTSCWRCTRGSSTAIPRRGFSKWTGSVSLSTSNGARPSRRPRWPQSWAASEWPGIFPGVRGAQKKQHMSKFVILRKYPQYVE